MFRRRDARAGRRPWPTRRCDRVRVLVGIVPGQQHVVAVGVERQDERVTALCVREHGAFIHQCRRVAFGTEEELRYFLADLAHQLRVVEVIDLDGLAGERIVPGFQDVAGLKVGKVTGLPRLDPEIAVFVLPGQQHTGARVAKYRHHPVVTDARVHQAVKTADHGLVITGPDLAESIEIVDGIRIVEPGIFRRWWPVPGGTGRQRSGSGSAGSEAQRRAAAHQELRHQYGLHRYSFYASVCTALKHAARRAGKPTLLKPATVARLASQDGARSAPYAQSAFRRQSRETRPPLPVRSARPPMPERADWCAADRRRRLNSRPCVAQRARTAVTRASIEKRPSGGSGGS